jgi:hypothetical protein
MIVGIDSIDALWSAVMNGVWGSEQQPCSSCETLSVLY